MSDFDMAYFDVKLFISKYATGVIYKGHFVEMDESKTFAYRVFDNENCGTELDVFIDINEAIKFIDGLKESEVGDGN